MPIVLIFLKLIIGIVLRLYNVENENAKLSMAYIYLNHWVVVGLVFLSFSSIFKYKY